MLLEKTADSVSWFFRIPFMTFSAPMSNFRTFQVMKNEKSNFRTFSGLFCTSGNPDDR